MITKEQEKLDWYLEFGNITRTETLSLPSWEEFNKIKELYFIFYVKQYEYTIFGTVKKTEFGKCDTLIISKENHKMSCGYDEIFEAEYTKENYIEACEICKKLFLGREV